MSSSIYFCHEIYGCLWVHLPFHTASHFHSVSVDRAVEFCWNAAVTGLVLKHRPRCLVTFAIWNAHTFCPIPQSLLMMMMFYYVAWTDLWHVASSAAHSHWCASLYLPLCGEACNRSTLHLKSQPFHSYLYKWLRLAVLLNCKIHVEKNRILDTVKLSDQVIQTKIICKYL